MNKSTSQQDEPRFHQERHHRQEASLPFASSTEHRTFVQQTYAEAAQARSAERSTNPYALLPDTLAFLSSLLDKIWPKVVVEFGSGESTPLFARWASQHNGRLISIEHDRTWVAEVKRRLSDDELPVVQLIHAPLRLVRRGFRQFFTYESMERLAPDVRRGQLFLLDGPHISGRELVLYFVLSSCSPGAVVVIDDFRHYAIRDMLTGIPAALGCCFVGEPIDDNSHGLYVLRCVHPPVHTKVPSLGLRSIARSYWRCLRDFRQYGTGDRS